MNQQREVFTARRRDRLPSSADGEREGVSRGQGSSKGNVGKAEPVNTQQHPGHWTMDIGQVKANGDTNNEELLRNIIMDRVTGNISRQAAHLQTLQNSDTPPRKPALNAHSRYGQVSGSAAAASLSSPISHLTVQSHSRLTPVSQPLYARRGGR